MFNRQYFEEVLSEQLRLMEHRARMELRLRDGSTFDIWALVAAHDHFVVLEVNPGGDLPERSEKWREENPGSPPWIFDQLAVPYEIIASTYLTSTRGDSAKEKPIGFHVEKEP